MPHCSQKYVVMPLCRLVVASDASNTTAMITPNAQTHNRNLGGRIAMRVRVVTRAMRGLLSVSDLLMPWKFFWPA